MRAAGQGAAMMRARLRAGLCVALGSAAALGGGWLVWQAPPCRPVAAHGYYTPPAAAPCGRDAPARGSAEASGR